MSEWENNLRSPEGLFKGDYINEFAWLYTSLKQLAADNITVDDFVVFCKMSIQDKGVFVRKFSETYKNTSIPQMYAERIKNLDAFVDEVNPLINKFLISKDDKDRNELTELVTKMVHEVKK